MFIRNNQCQLVPCGTLPWGKPRQVTEMSQAKAGQIQTDQSWPVAPDVCIQLNTSLRNPRKRRSLTRLSSFSTPKSHTKKHWILVHSDSVPKHLRKRGLAMVPAAPCTSVSTFLLLTSLCYLLFCIQFSSLLELSTSLGLGCCILLSFLPLLPWLISPTMKMRPTTKSGPAAPTCGLAISTRLRSCLI